MKKILFACLLATLVACNEKKADESVQVAAATPNNTVATTPTVTTTEPTKTEFAKIEFEKVEYKFGKVQEGDMVKHTFKFKNTGNIPLIISEVAPQCGCTSTAFTKTPVAPNESGEITLELDTKNKRGEIDKNARVVANIEGGNVFLYLRGEVISNEVMAGPYATPR